MSWISGKCAPEPMTCVACGATVRGGSCTGSNCGANPANVTACTTCGGVRFKGTCGYSNCASNGGAVGR